MPGKEFFRTRYTPPRMAAQDEAEMLLYGEIIQDMPEDWKWSQEDKSAVEFDRALKDARAQGARKLLLRINSPGGIVNESVAMRSCLMNAGFDEINIRIEGMCASAATVVAAVPGAHVQITPGSEYMIHNPWSWGAGNADELDMIVQHLRSEEKTFNAMYQKRSGQTEEKIKDWMDAETWFTAEEAVEYGFCDEVTEEKGLAPIAACADKNILRVMKAMYAKVPEKMTAAEKDEISNAGEAVAATKAPDNKQPHKEDNHMEGIENLTLDELRQGNPQLYDSLMRDGAEQERERIQDIRDMTPAGDAYEEMAQDAISKGMSAMDYHKAIIKAQKEKGKEFMEARKKETAPAANVAGAAAEETNRMSEDEKINASAKETAAFAKQYSGNGDGMY